MLTRQSKLLRKTGYFYIDHVLFSLNLQSSCKKYILFLKTAKRFFFTHLYIALYSQNSAKREVVLCRK